MRYSAQAQGLLREVNTALRTHANICDSDFYSLVKAFNGCYMTGAVPSQTAHMCRLIWIKTDHVCRYSNA